jgi:signal transduction histidine kinase
MPARVSHDTSVCKIGIWTRRHGMHQIVGAPLIVDGCLWGMATILSYDKKPLPADTEPRMLDFMELLATAIANAENLSKLLDSHTRIVAASDEVRRRIERDLHDVAQQRLVCLQHRLRAALADIPSEQVKLSEQLSWTAKGLSSVLADLQEITRGLHPVTLSRSGLRPALKSLAQRSRVPVELDVRVDRRLTGHIEVAIYYTVSEALTNVAKYAHATKVRVDLDIEDRNLRLSIHDNGLGGADPARGSGLAGLKDRVETLGGDLDLISPVGRGTSLLVTIPIEADQPPNARTPMRETRA